MINVNEHARGTAADIVTSAIVGVQLVVWAAAARVLLPWVPLPYLAKAAKGLRRTPLLRPGARDNQALYRLVDRATRITHGAQRCLPRSLLLFGALPKEHEPELVLGVRKAGALMQAHAWVETGDSTAAKEAESAEHFPEGEFTVLLRLK